jgi:hypothetical protein
MKRGIDSPRHRCARHPSLLRKEGNLFFYFFTLFAAKPESVIQQSADRVSQLCTLLFLNCPTCIIRKLYTTFRFQMSLKQPVTLISRALIQAGICVPFLIITLIIYGICREGSEIEAAVMYGLFAIPGYVIAVCSYLIFNIIETRIKTNWSILKYAAPLFWLGVGLFAISGYKESDQQVFFIIIATILFIEPVKIIYQRVLKTL